MDFDPVTGLLVVGLGPNGLYVAYAKAQRSQPTPHEVPDAYVFQLEGSVLRKDQFYVRCPPFLLNVLTAVA